MSSDSSEFLRRRPRKHSRNIPYDILNILIPVTLCFVGLVASAQFFAAHVGYNPRYCSYPVIVSSHRFLFIPKGYPFFNPGSIYLAILAGSTDHIIQENVLPTLFVFLFFVGTAAVCFFVMGALKERFYDQDANRTGSARWAVEKELKKFGLAEKAGVVLAEFFSADVRFAVNPENSSISLHQKKSAPLVCHQGGTNTLVCAPTRSCKGVGSVIPTSLSYPGHMILFDPKGELWNITAGWRRKFSHVLKFSPVSDETVHFNPIEEFHLDKRLGSEIDLVDSIIFETGEKKGSDDNSFWDNNARLFFNCVIYHVLTCGRYPDSVKNIASIIQLIKTKSTEKKDPDDEDEESGTAFLDEMINSWHFDAAGVHQKYMDEYVISGAAQTKGMNPKVRSDVYSTLFSKVTLFTDAYIASVTSHSDFKLDDFYDSTEPISLYLTVPYGQLARVMPVFKIIINFILNKFSSSEIRLGKKERKLSHRLLFLLDEFPSLGKQSQIMGNLGVLAGYGINFFLVCQSIKQLDDIYGKDNSFLSNSKTVLIYAPGELEEAEKWSKLIGEESYENKKLSSSGSRYSAGLNNLSISSENIKRNLINPDELMKLPPSQCIIMNQGMPPYIGKKNVYYDDPRFKYIAYGSHPVDFPIIRKIRAPLDFDLFNIKKGQVLLSFNSLFKTEKRLPGFPAPYDIKDLLTECAGLPSQKAEKKKSVQIHPNLLPGEEPDQPEDSSDDIEKIAGEALENDKPSFGGLFQSAKDRMMQMSPDFAARRRSRYPAGQQPIPQDSFGTENDDSHFGIPADASDDEAPPPSVLAFDLYSYSNSGTDDFNVSDDSNSTDSDIKGEING